MNKKSLFRLSFLIIFILAFSSVVINKIISKKEVVVSNEYVKEGKVQESKKEKEEIVVKELIDNTEEFYINDWQDYTNENIPVLIYKKEISQNVGGDRNRQYPTVQIIRKVGNNDSELLAQVGKIGEYPNYYTLSPDNKFLLINLESKLQILNLETKELKDLFIPKKRVASISYSPDGQKLFIWDQKYARQDEYYYAHLFDIVSHEDQILAEGDLEWSFFGGVWRDDDNVTMRQAMGEGSIPHYFNLNTNELIKTSGNYNAGLLSLNGELMSVVKEYTTNACNDFSASAPSLYNIVDPVSWDILGVIGQEDYMVYTMAFSPDNEEVLYRVGKAWNSREECDKDVDFDYFIAKIDTGESREIDNPTEIMQSWEYRYIGATSKYDYEAKTWTIFIDGQPLIKSDKSLGILGQFIQ